MYKVATFYCFVAIDDVDALQQKLYERGRILHIKGIILLANEGINATISGDSFYVKHFVDYLRQDPRFSGIECKYSDDSNNPFLRLKIRIKKEIVTLNVPSIDVQKNVGTYLSPDEWNALIQEDDVVVIDTRNDYEIAIGQFKGAINPCTEKFSDLPAWVEQHKDILQDKRIAMYCTGGIRCEKSTSYMLEQGYEHVYHLQGGILKYLEMMDKDASMWEGDCFVFDRRVAVNHDLEASGHMMCGACRRPITQQDTTSNSYEEGVSCDYCVTIYSEAQQQNFRMRQQQITLAHKRGLKHLGAKKSPKKHAHQNNPILYSFRRCPYAMRARMTLFETSIPFILREISLKDKPADMVIKSPKATVPVLVLQDGSVLDESLDIMLYALSQWQDMHQKAHIWLGDDSVLLHNMLSFLHDDIDNNFKTLLDHYKYPTRYITNPDATADDIQQYSQYYLHKIIEFLRPYDAILAKQPYLFGDIIRLGDIGFAPFLRQYIQVDDTICMTYNLPNIYRYYTQFINNDIFTRVMSKYSLWKIPPAKKDPIYTSDTPIYRDDIIINP